MPYLGLAHLFAFLLIEGPPLIGPFTAGNILNIGVMIFVAGGAWAQLHGLKVELSHRRIQFDKAREEWQVALAKEQDERTEIVQDLRDLLSTLGAKLQVLEATGTTEGHAAWVSVETIKTTLAVNEERIRTMQAQINQLEHDVNGLLRRKGRGPNAG